MRNIIDLQWSAHIFFILKTSNEATQIIKFGKDDVLNHLFKTTLYSRKHLRDMA